MSRWLTWEAPISGAPPNSEPTKPAKPSFDGFDGSPLEQIQKMGPGREMARASLARSGVRFLSIDGAAVAGVWSDRDGPEVRDALRDLGAGSLPVVYLDGPGVPVRWKGRAVPGDPVPEDVLAAMESEPKEPWRVRDEMLAARRWRPESVESLRLAQRSRRSAKLSG